MEIIKYNKSSIFSIFALIAYFTPWWYGATQVSLGFNIMAFFWFNIAWIIFIIHLIKSIKLKNKNDTEYKYYLINVVIIFISYVFIIIGFFNNYIVSV